jgi:hypothetical protein
MSDKGQKKAQADYFNQNIKKWNKNSKRLKEHRKKHREDDYRENDGTCETSKSCFKRGEKE